MDMLTYSEKAIMLKDGETSGTGAKPKRTLVQKDRVGNKVLSQMHPLVKDLDVQLAKVFIASNASLNLLDCKPFGDFCKKILDG